MPDEVNPGIILCEDCHRVMATEDGPVCEDCQHLRRSPKARAEAEAAANERPPEAPTNVTVPGPGGTSVQVEPRAEKGS